MKTITKLDDSDIKQAIAQWATESLGRPIKDSEVRISTKLKRVGRIDGATEYISVIEIIETK